MTDHSWQQQLTHAFKSVYELCEYLALDVADIHADQAIINFPLRVPRSFVERMEEGNPHDPLLKQVLPVTAEKQTISGFTLDPVGDLIAATESGVIHKYHGRALLINTGNCAIHCRYCFRRNFPYSNFQLGAHKQQKALAYLQQHSEISEVILSGGDPLSLSDTKLSTLIQELNAISHLKRIRIHSRFPIVLPARLTNELIQRLTTTNKQVIMVIHCNHANELNQEVDKVCRQMRQAGIMLLNQSVLLKDINDTVSDLKQLSEKLFNFGVIPYYLHLLDRATGTAHFEVKKSVAILLIQQLQTQLSGYLVPKLVEEKQGNPAKTGVFP